MAVGIPHRQGRSNRLMCWREQNAGNKRMAKLREARLAQEKSGTPKSKPKRKVSVGAHRKTHGFKPMVMRRRDQSLIRHKIGDFSCIRHVLYRK
jgi:hypothetical protein